MSGALLSLIGLIFSLLAFLSANRAKQAAEAAKMSIDNLDATTEISICLRKLKEAKQCVEHGNWPLASYLIEDVCEKLSGLCSAERVLLENTERAALSGKVEHLKAVATSLDRAKINGKVSSTKIGETLRTVFIDLSSMQRKVRDNA